MLRPVAGARFTKAFFDKVHGVTDVMFHHYKITRRNNLSLETANDGPQKIGIATLEEWDLFNQGQIQVQGNVGAEDL